MLLFDTARNSHMLRVQVLKVVHTGPSEMLLLLCSRSFLKRLTLCFSVIRPRTAESRRAESESDVDTLGSVASDVPVDDDISDSE